MKLHIKLLILSISFGCSNDGKVKQPPPKKEPPQTISPDLLPKNRTNVKFELYGKFPEFKKNCRYPLDIGSLSGSDLKIDGLDDDWLNQGFRNQEPAKTQQDLNQIVATSIAIQNQSAYFFVELTKLLTEQQWIYIEFYSGLKQGNANISLEHVIKIGPQNAYIFENNEWTLIPKPFIYQGATSSKGLEFRLSIQNFLSGVVNSPLWGYQISIGSPKQWNDHSSLLFYKGFQAEGYGQFNFQGCSPDDFSPLPLSYQEITSGSFAKPISLIRYIEEKVGTMLGSDMLPISAIPIIGIDKGVQFVIPKRLSDSLAFGTIFPPHVFLLQGSDDKFGTMDYQGYPTDPFPQIKGIYHISLKFIEFFFSFPHFGLDPTFKKLLTESLASKMVLNNAGKEHWLTLVGSADSWVSKLGMLIGNYATDKDLILAFNQSKMNASGFFEFLKEKNPESLDDLELIENIYQKGPFLEASENIDLNNFFKDSDFDGLPSFLENSIGTSNDIFDTDQDQWSDLAEYVNNTDPNNKASHPTFLYPDGLFAEVLDLLPGKIVSDNDDEFTPCPGTADIEAVVAVVDDHRLLVALRHGMDPPSPTRWEIDISMADQNFTARIIAKRNRKEFELRDASDGLLFVYKTAVPIGIKALELSLVLDHLGMSRPDDSLRLNISSFTDNEQSKFCDDTGWFEPLWVN